MNNKDSLLNVYRTMNVIRKFEQKALTFFEQNILRGSVHLCIGQEATPAAICSLLTDSDYITSTHRGHGHCIAKGAEPKYALAELMGRADGYCKGRGGSMHIADFETGNLGANAIVAGGVPIAVGAALASKLKGKDNVAVTFFGDGASNEGVFHEALNIASVWKLPVLFVCENNGYGISVPFSQSTSVKQVAERGAAYDIPSYVVDGNNVFEIMDVAREAIDRARSGDGPTLIECMTYRWLGHWTGDPQTYRSKEEVEEWKKRCPIARMRAQLITDSVCTEKELAMIEENTHVLIEQAAEFALASPVPDIKSVLENVFY